RLLFVIFSAALLFPFRSIGGQDLGAAHPAKWGAHEVRTLMLSRWLRRSFCMSLIVLAGYHVSSAEKVTPAYPAASVVRLEQPDPRNVSKYRFVTRPLLQVEPI